MWYIILLMIYYDYKLLMLTIFINIGNAVILWRKRVEIGLKDREPGKADWAQYQTQREKESQTRDNR